jgi:hypothetical protein
MKLTGETRLGATITLLAWGATGFGNLADPSAPSVTRGPAQSRDRLQRWRG